MSEGFVVYPNPVTDGMLKVSLKDLVSGNYVIEIADLSGKQVYKEEVRVEENMVKSISVPFGEWVYPIRRDLWFNKVSMGLSNQFG